MMLWALLLGWSMSGVVSGTTTAPKITLWTPGHLDSLHDALLEGRPLRAELTSVRAVRALGGADPAQPSPAKLSLWVPRGQEQLAANEWQDEWSDRSAVVVREADSDDGLLDEDGYDAEPMSPSWLRGGRGGGVAATDAPNPTDNNGLGSVVRVPRSPRSPGWLRARGSLGHFRRKRSASPGPNEASSEDASVAADTAKKTSAAAPGPGPGPQQAKAARGHQFITGRNEKEPPPVVREVEAAHPDKTDGRSSPPPPPPTHASPVAAGSSRIGAGRDALGLRVNEIPQGPRYSSVYESETLRHAADHRHYTADNYGSHNSYATTYGGSYGSYPPYHAMPLPPSPGHPGLGQQPLSPLSSSPSQASHPGPLAPRSAPTATPRRIIYYASLPDPAPAPPGGLPHHGHPGHPGLAPPGSSRVPHEYRGPPYDVNGAYSADNRYPPANDNLYRYTIIDAEPPGPLLGYRSTAAPYRDRPAPAAFPQPYHLKSSAAPDAGPQAASPIQYTQYDYNGIGARTASSSALVDSKQGLPPGVPLSDDPYRGFNPRQPAPWSMQVGTRLTVKDDGYGSSSPGGGLPPAARRFYVTSQQQPVGQGQPGPQQPQQWQDVRDPRDPYGQPQARFPRPLDRSRSEARNRLFR